MGYLAAAGAYLIIGLVVSFILMVSYRRKSLENFTGEIQTKKFTAVPLAAWDGGFLSFFKIASQ